MKTISLNDRGNIVLHNGNIVLKRGVEALKQDLNNLIKLEIGENPDNIDEGIDYKGDTLDSLGGIEFLIENIKKRLMSNKEVTNIISAKYIINGDILEITTNLTSIYGDIKL